MLKVVVYENEMSENALRRFNKRIGRGGIVTALVLLLSLVQAAGAEETPSPYESLKPPQENVAKKVLDNGLTVLIMERPDVDLVSVEVRVKAASALEEEYLGSGISHLVEHMVFKGTKKRRPGEIEEAVRSYGGFINGTTTFDTSYFHITAMPEYLPNILGLLKDMMLNASFPNDEFEKERQVILKEMKLNRDEPQSRISNMLWETAYISHPYRYPIIGREEVFKRLTRDDIMRFYEKQYVPNRMVVAIVGNVNGKTAMPLAEKEFKAMRPSDYRPIRSDAEPAQVTKRTRVEELQINLAYLSMAFHTTSMLDEDAFALDVIAIILGEGDNSRLNKSLFKEKGLVYTIGSYNYTPKDPGLFMITAILDKKNFEDAQRAVLAEIDKVKEGVVSDEELEKAKRAVLTGYLSFRQTVSSLASDLAINECLAGDYDFSRKYVEGIEKVTKEDIVRAANKYFKETNLTVAGLMPQPRQAAAPEPKAEKKGEPQAKTLKQTLPNGIRILVTEKKGVPLVSMAVAFLGGVRVEEKNNNGISNLTAMMLLRGTKERREDEIMGAVENRGAAIDSFSGMNSFGINVTNLMKGDADFVIELLKDVLTNPVFPDEEIDKVKRLASAAIKDEEDDIFRKGITAFKRLLFEGHPYAFRIIGEEKTIDLIKRKDLMNFYNAWGVPDNMVISVAGDVNADEMTKKLKAAFGDMKRKRAPEAKIPKARPRSDIRTERVVMNKEESLVLIGYKTITVLDKDRYAFSVLTTILSGMGGRLYDELREKQGLAYALGCSNVEGVDPGYFIFYVTTTKGKLKQSKAGLLDELKRIRAGKISGEEIELAKKKLIGGHRVEMQSNDNLAFMTALEELYGAGYESVYKFDSKIKAVTKDDLKRILHKYFPLDGYTEVIITGID